MRRGTRVGQAYVSVTADGSGINDDIVDSVDGADVGPAGERAGRDYGDGFSQEFSDRLDEMTDRIGKRLSERLGRSISGSLTRAFNNTSESGLGARIGETIGEALSDRLESTLAGALDMIEQAQSSGGVSGNSSGGSSSSGLYGPPPAEQRRLESAYRADRAYDLARTRMIASAYRQNDAFDRTRTRMLAEAYRLNVQFEQGRLDGQGRSQRASGGNDNFGTRIGNLFGAGSRNNFLNLFGKTIGGVAGLIGKAKTAATGLFETFQTGFNEAQSGFLGLGKVGAGTTAVIGQIASAAAASLPAIAVGALVAIVAMSALVSVASALLAILVAISATVVSALVGALLVGAGALGAVAVAAGLAVVAFTSLTDAQKTALAADFAPLKQELTGLGQLMLTELIPYFSTWSNNLQTALYQLAPLASVFGEALGKAGDEITSSLSGPGFTLLTTQLGVFLPSIIARLSIALGGFLNGTAGVFSALLPQVNRFAGYLADVALRFSNFANSASGQNKISDFIDRAVVSLISFSGFVREALGFLSDLLFSVDSQQAGNSIFDSLRDSFAGFREDLKGDDLRNWFERALDFGGDVKDLIISIKNAIKKLDSDGTLEKVSGGIKGLADGLQNLVDIASTATAIFEGLWNAIFDPAALGTSIFDAVGNQIDSLTGKTETLRVSLVNALGVIGALTSAAVRMNDANAVAANIANQPVQGPGISTSGQSALSGMTSVPTQAALTASGLDALNKTSMDSGGYKPDPVKKTPKYKNPYVEFANSLIASAPTVAEKIRASMKTLNQTAGSAIREASDSSDSGSVISSLDSMADNLKESGKSAVTSAQDALSSAAESLANASSAKAAKQALKKVKASQKELKATIAAQAKINAAAAIVNGQKVLNEGNVVALLNGVRVQNATLADYAEARSRLAETLGKANEKLTAAISLRDQYNESVISAVQQFGSILSAQAKTINGVQQALTAADITTNLQDRLDQIRKFQADLNILLSQGLSNDAYKQLVDAGVETGGAYASALVQGGQGSVQLTNDLTEQIKQAANDLGGQASNRLYQAGVDAAQGLVDGLLSLSGQLDSAAAALGDSIAAAVKRSLGIASPSKRMIEDMGYVGDGIVLGLKRQHSKVGNASDNLSGMIAMTPSLAAAYAEGRVPAAVSGNQAQHVWQITTPTSDPTAVAQEMINEMTGRLG